MAPSSTAVGRNRQKAVHATALLGEIRGASGQSAASFPWCAKSFKKEGGGTSCYYASYQQRRADQRAGAFASPPARCALRSVAPHYRRSEDDQGGGGGGVGRRKCTIHNATSKPRMTAPITSYLSQRRATRSLVLRLINQFAVGVGDGHLKAFLAKFHGRGC